MRVFLDSSRARRFTLIAFDICCFVLMDAMFYIVSRRASGSMPVYETRLFIINSAVQLCCMMGMRGALRMYQNIWRYPDVGAYFRLVTADAIGSAAALIVLRIAGLYYGMWQATVVGALTALLALTARFMYGLIYRRISAPKEGKARRPAAIIGAGRLGSYLAADLISNRNSEFNPLFFVDRDEIKVNNYIAGIKVYDPVAAVDLIERLEIHDVIIAITTRNKPELLEIFNHYRDLGCRVHVYDRMVGNSDVVTGGVIREFSIEDLLFRDPLDLMENTDLSVFAGKSILVTGGGGSIGSELCRQIAKCGPAKLVIFDIYENNAYEIEQELIHKYGDSLALFTEIGSVRDAPRLDELFDTYRPDIVFHAAAHKHVPLMEHCGAEAIKNNVLGTYNVANAAEKYGTERFILISTDKAVNPTNIMGASKRVCEMIVQCRTDSKTCFAAVRFGNVLGSNGSVIPLFKKQIAEGGPVTLTDKRIIRYFMTITEAVNLVMQAGVMAKDGELFVLNMGNPVKIYDLAVNMIRLSGFEPEKDIKIEEVGLRPGEKLYEELLMQSEHLEKTRSDLIFIERDTPYTRAEVDEKIDILVQAMQNGTLHDAVAQVVPTYRSPEEVNLEAERSREMQMVGA